MKQVDNKKNLFSLPKTLEFLVYSMKLFSNRFGTDKKY